MPILYEGEECLPITDIVLNGANPFTPNVVRVIKGEDATFDVSWDGTGPFEVRFFNNVFGPTPPVGSFQVNGNSLVTDIGPINSNGPAGNGTQTTIVISNGCSTYTENFAITCAECETVADVIENPPTDPFNGTITLNTLAAITPGGSLTPQPSWVWIHDGGTLTKGPVTSGDWTYEVNTGGDIEATSSGPTSQDLSFQWCSVNDTYNCEVTANAAIQFSCDPVTIDTTYPDLDITDGDSVSITVPVSGTAPYIYAIEVDCGAGPSLYLGPYPSSNNNYPFTFTPGSNLDGCEFIVKVLNSCSTATESFIINIDSPFNCTPPVITDGFDVPSQNLQDGWYFNDLIAYTGSGPFDILVEKACGGGAFQTVESLTTSAINHWINDGPLSCTDSPCEYRVTVSNDCGSDTDTAIAIIEEVEPGLSFSCPSTVTKGNNLNMAFDVLGGGDPVDIQLQRSIGCTGTFQDLDVPVLGVTSYTWNRPTNSSTPDNICYRVEVTGKCETWYTDFCSVDFVDDTCDLPEFSTLWMDQTAQDGQLVTLPYNVTGPVTLRIYRECPGQGSVLIGGPYSWGGGANSWSYTAQNAHDGCTFRLEATNSCGSVSTFSTLTISNPPPTCTTPTIAGCPSAAVGDVNDPVIVDLTNSVTPCPGKTINWNSLQYRIPSGNPSPWAGQSGSYPEPVTPTSNHPFAPYQGYWSARAMDGQGTLRFSPLHGFTGTSQIEWRVADNSGNWTPWSCVKATVLEPSQNNFIHYVFDPSITPYLNADHYAAFARAEKYFNATFNGPTTTTQGTTINGACIDVKGVGSGLASAGVTEWRGASFTTLPKRADLNINTGQVGFLNGTSALNTNDIWMWDRIIIHETLHGLGVDGYHPYSVNNSWVTPNPFFSSPPCGTTVTIPQAVANWQAAGGTGNIIGFDGGAHFCNPPHPNDIIATGTDVRRVEPVSAWVLGYLEGLGWTVDYTKSAENYLASLGWAQP